MYLRYDRSIASSTAVSIGRIINGIAANPMHVGSHLPAIPGTLARLDRCPAAHVILLITKPGIITDANICQINTSPAVFIAGTIRWSSTGFCNEASKYKIRKMQGSLQTYLFQNQIHLPGMF